jgi:methionyl-tRNA formyltransferase
VQAGSSGIVIACAEGLLNVTQLQKPGGKRLPAREFLQGFPLTPGIVCGV